MLCMSTVMMDRKNKKKDPRPVLMSTKCHKSIMQPIAHVSGISSAAVFGRCRLYTNRRSFSTAAADAYIFNGDTRLSFSTLDL